MSGLPDPRERPWLTVAEVAEITHEGEKAIRAAVDAGQLPSLRVGRYVRIPTAPLYSLCGLTPEGETPRRRLQIVQQPDGGPDAAA
jgi:excisionase family DNA binding protein